MGHENLMLTVGAVIVAGIVLRWLVLLVVGAVAKRMPPTEDEKRRARLAADEIRAETGGARILTKGATVRDAR